GLIPALKRDGKLQPFYLDSYGQDWEAGPLESLAATVQVALDKEDRANLGFEQPVTASDVFPLLAVFREKVGRTPLVIFDQFDDYQATHCKEFRTSRGKWLNPTSLAKNNHFWKDLSECLGHGRLHVLFVARADMAPALHAVRFAEPESRPLDR